MQAALGSVAASLATLKAWDPSFCFRARPSGARHRTRAMHAFPFQIPTFGLCLFVTLFRFGVSSVQW